MRDGWLSERNGRGERVGLRSGGTPGAVAAIEIDGIEAVLGEDAHGGVTALPHLAVCNNAAVAEFIESTAQVIERNVDGVRDGAAFEFGDGANIHQQCSCRQLGIDFVPLDRGAESVAQILRNIAEVVDGVFRRTILRGVGEFEISEGARGNAEARSGREHIHALIDALFADSLSAENQIGLGINDELERERLGAGVVARVRDGVSVDDANIATSGPKRAFGRTETRDGEVEDADNGSAECRP